MDLGEAPSHLAQRVSPISCYFAWGGIFALEVPYSPQYNFPAFFVPTNFSFQEMKEDYRGDVMSCDVMSSANSAGVRVC